MKIAFGCDPNAAELKHGLMDYVQSLGHETGDLGSDDPIYANVAIDCAKAVASGEYDRGILLCGTGIGVSIAANKVKGAYAACVHDVYQAKRAELSNHANISSLWARRWWALNSPNVSSKNIWIQSTTQPEEVRSSCSGYASLRQKTNLTRHAPANILKIRHCKTLRNLLYYK